MENTTTVVTLSPEFILGLSIYFSVLVIAAAAVFIALLRSRNVQVPDEYQRRLWDEVDRVNQKIDDFNTNAKTTPTPIDDMLGLAALFLSDKGVEFLKVLGFERPAPPIEDTQPIVPPTDTQLADDRIPNGLGVNDETR